MKRLKIFVVALLCTAAAFAQRPAPAQRAFQSAAVEAYVQEVARQIPDADVRRMFEQCFPNTLDTTIRFSSVKTAQGTTITLPFVITGDINAMWLRDSAAQVWPYLRLCSKDPKLAALIRGVIERQMRCLCLDVYANAFTECEDSLSPNWRGDFTEMLPGVFERKYELDSQVYPFRLAWGYYEVTGDASVFNETWLRALQEVLKSMRREQKRDVQPSPYTFMRETARMHDTQSNAGAGHPARSCGLIASSFRPSDDATIFPYLIPSNIMAASVLRHIAKAFDAVPALQAKKEAQDLRDEALAIAGDIEKGVREHAIVKHPTFGEIYAFEVDGFGNHLLMDDANVPSLLALPYISDVPMDDPVYQNTRRFCLSEQNPYFFRGTAGEGIGGPHVGMGFVWPMSIILRGLTTRDAQERALCLEMLRRTHAETYFMHEAFYKDDASRFTRSWFAWANTLFGEFVAEYYTK